VVVRDRVTKFVGGPRLSAALRYTVIETNWLESVKYSLKTLFYNEDH